MSIFFISALHGAEEIQKALNNNSETIKFLAVKPDQWFVAFDGTSVQLSNELGITGSENSTGSALVLAVSSYYGRAPTNVWEWVAVNWGG